jgi:hypothetical protein
VGNNPQSMIVVVGLLATTHGKQEQYIRDMIAKKQEDCLFLIDA